MDTVPRFPPRNIRTNATAKVCSVNGTVNGMLIQVHTMIRTAPTAIYTRSATGNFPLSLLFVCSVDTTIISSLFPDLPVGNDHR